MEKKTDSTYPEQWLKDLPVTNEPVSFKAEEMLLCGKCQRKSPPTRLKCFYCGAELKVSVEQSQYLKPKLRKLEDWEKGFNIIFLSKSEVADSTQIAKLVNFEQNDLQKFFETNKSLPLARLESNMEAEVLANRLNESGLESKIVSDESLKADVLPRRLRGIEFYDDRVGLILFNADQIVEISLQDIDLIVVGVFFERRIESTQSLKKKEAHQVLETAEISTDEMLIDLYIRSDSDGFRIETKGFDFSCLGAEKSLLAKDNMKKLVEKLRSLAPNAKFNDDYLRVRAELSKVWEVSQRNDSSGVHRQGLGRFKRVNTFIINNLIQFTRYSRLLRNLL